MILVSQNIFLWMNGGGKWRELEVLPIWETLFKRLRSFYQLNKKYCHKLIQLNETRPIKCEQLQFPIYFSLNLTLKNRQFSIHINWLEKSGPLPVSRKKSTKKTNNWCVLGPIFMPFHRISLFHLIYWIAKCRYSKATHTHRNNILYHFQE